MPGAPLKVFLGAHGVTTLLPSQHYNEDRHVVERHGRDSGPRKEWHGPGSQGGGGGYHDTRRVGDSRAGGSMMAPHSRYLFPHHHPLSPGRWSREHKGLGWAVEVVGV